jgi:hypothetical protein
LAELDSLLGEPVELHCIGAFQVVAGYGLARATIDLDYRTLNPFHYLQEFQELAGEGSALARKHRVYVQRPGVDSIPES